MEEEGRKEREEVGGRRRGKREGLDILSIEKDLG